MRIQSGMVDGQAEGGTHLKDRLISRLTLYNNGKP